MAVTSLTLSRSPEPAPRSITGLAGDARRLREDAQQRYGEVDLLVAALRDHVRDLQLERDRLRAELERVSTQARLRTSDWMWRGMKPAR